MSVNEAKTAILNNKTALGIEFGSTRIKAVLVDDRYNPIASGSYEWENRYENGVWTYSLDDIHKGLQGSYSDLTKDVQEKYGVELTSVGALGISAMMHGYMPPGDGIAALHDPRRATRRAGRRHGLGRHHRRGHMRQNPSAHSDDRLGVRHLL